MGALKDFTRVEFDYQDDEPYCRLGPTGVEVPPWIGLLLENEAMTFKAGFKLRDAVYELVSFSVLVHQGAVDFGALARLDWPAGLSTLLARVARDTDPHWESRPWRAARTYVLARAVGDYPTRAVARALGISEPAAGQVIRRARQAGLLGPTVKGRTSA